MVIGTVAAVWGAVAVLLIAVAVVVGASPVVAASVAAVVTSPPATVAEVATLAPVAPSPSPTVSPATGCEGSWGKGAAEACCYVEADLKGFNLLKW